MFPVLANNKILRAWTSPILHPQTTLDSNIFQISGKYSTAKPNRLDDEKSSEEVDFWLDVTAHEVLWRLYVRATKRRMAIAEREMKLERGKAAQEELAMEAAYAAEVAALGIADLEGKSAHKKQPSVTLDMYEPHWSAANRYLEMSSPEGSSIIDPACNTSTNPSSPTTPQQHRSLTRQYLDDASQSNASSDQILMVHNALRNPISPPVGHFPVAANRIQLVRLPGAVPASWIHPSEMETQGGTDSNISEGTPTGALPSTPAAKASLIAKDGKTSGHGLRIAMSIGENIEANDISATTKSMTTAGKLSTGSDVGPRSVTAGANSSYQRAVTSGNGGVTKEDLIKSAERIYCKYLIPQAEKRVRIPGSVRKRVALLMDPLLLDRENKQPSTITCTVSDGQSGGAGPSSPVLKSKNNWGSSRISATPPQHGLILSNSDLLNEKSDKSKNSSISEPTSSRLSSSTNNNKEKQIKRQLSSTSLDRTASASGASPTLQQPDQDIGLAFAEAREIVFEGMESYYFPRFLKARAYGNMVPSHRLMRAIVGLLCLFVGFSIVLTLIFLDVRPRSYRALAMVPISVGTFLCTTFQFNICPVIAAAGVSETGFWRYAKVKEPYLMKLHRQRGVKVVVVAVLYTICVGLVFGLVPGHRL
ncbi:Bud site selection protein, Revert to axial protein 1 [Linnemannia zychae]|nr:Bud site selection protein, Revert to axial protein 1 [Linnemannia zychae]